MALSKHTPFLALALVGQLILSAYLITPTTTFAETNLSETQFSPPTPIEMVPPQTSEHELRTLLVDQLDESFLIAKAIIDSALEKGHWSNRHHRDLNRVGTRLSVNQKRYFYLKLQQYRDQSFLQFSAPIPKLLIVQAL